MEETKKISFNEFRKKALLKTEDMSTLILTDPPSTRFSYFIYKTGLKITPNHISLFRLFFLAPLAILFLFLAPLLNLKIFYLLFAIIVYLMILSDGMDGHLARGSNQTSNFGAFLDLISDRILIIIFVTLIFSLGFFVNNLFLVYGSVLVFIAKLYNMTIINKVFYHGEGNLNKEDIFSAQKEVKKLGITGFNSFTTKLNKILKIKRWCGFISSCDRMFITVILPALLIFFNLEIISILMMYILVVLFFYFYVSRTNNLIKSYHQSIERKKK